MAVRGGASLLQPAGWRPASHDGGGTVGWPSVEQQCDAQGCWPRLFIVGTQKGATTSLFGALHQEGAVCGTVMSGAAMQAVPAFRRGRGGYFSTKEAHIFDLPDDSMWSALAQQPSLYQSLYRKQDCPQRTFLDATPRYIRDPAVPARMVELMPASWLPQLRVVLTIREPIARDLSWFNHKVNRAIAQQSKGEAPLAGDFCSTSGGSDQDGYPSYEGEAMCRKLEMDNCLKQARRERLRKGESIPHNLSQVLAQVAPRNVERLEDYGDCVEAIWHNKRMPTRSEVRSSDSLSSWEPPLLSWGLYLPQIRAWTRRILRSQLLVLDFDRLVARPDDVLPRVTSFMGLPALQKNELPHENELPYDRKVDVISCDTAQLLHGVFGEWNERLALALREDVERGDAPPQEPLFEGFNTTVPCENEEHVWLARHEQEKAERKEEGWA